MKAFTLIILISFGFNNFSYAQNNKSNVDESQNNDENRRAVALTGEEINKLVATNEWEYAELALKKGFNTCKDLGNSKLCEAGMNFNGGFLFQQMSIMKKSNSMQNQDRAIDYYRKVLETYPDNQSAMSNMIKVQELGGVNEITIGLMKELAVKYPAKRASYLNRIGNLYLNENNFEGACDYFYKAYTEDPFSEEACDGMVDLFTQYDFVCRDVEELELFAYNCSEIGLPNYAEKMVRKQIVNSFNQQKFNKALESIVLWAYILGENGWLDAQQVIKLHKDLSSIKGVDLVSSKRINKALKELSEILKSGKEGDLSFIDFWNERSPSFFINDDWDKIRPVTALMRILYHKGKAAKIRKDLNTAEKYWQEALDISNRIDKPFFTFVASDMATMYHANRKKLDPKDKKISELIIKLFKGKGDSYSKGDYEMIHKYHTTLGGIYYDRKKWKGLGAKNALFQLERATSERYGYTIEPSLKRMLGNTYIAIGSTSDGIDTYEEVITEYLELDQVRKADKLHQMITSSYQDVISSRLKRKWDQLGNIISFRKELRSKDNPVLESSNNTFSYLTRVSIIENEAKKSLENKFVEVQIFKGLSDLAAQIPVDRLGEQQLIYSSALEKIVSKDELSSPSDYYRINLIKMSFESSIEGSKQLKVAQMNKKTNRDWSTNNKEGYRVFQISSLNRQIEVPNQLFELNGIIKTDYNQNNEIQTAEYKFKRGKFEKVIRS